MSDTPDKIWVPLEHAEDAANQPADGLIEYTRTDTIAAALIEAERRGMMRAAEIAAKHNSKYFSEKYETTHKRKNYTWYQADAHANTRLNIISEDIEAAILQAAEELK